MSLYSTDVSRLCKYSSQSKHGHKHNCPPRDSQQAQLYWGEGAVREYQVSTVCGNSHYTFKWELPCFMYQAIFSLICRFPPETIHWSWKLNPSIFLLPTRLYHSSQLNICFPGCHYVSGELCATCSVSGRKMIAGKWERRVFFFFLPPDFQWEFGGTLACSLSSHCSVNKPETLQQKWLMSGSW